jgi:hypothetical protein
MCVVCDDESFFVGFFEFFCTSASDVVGHLSSPSSPRLPEMISEISGTPVNLVAKHWIKRFSFPIVKHSMIKESSLTDLLIELKIIVLSVSVRLIPLNSNVYL